MKTRIAITMLLLGLFVATTAFSSPPSTTSTRQMRKEIKKQVRQNVKYPQFALDERFECCVLVSITVQNDGSLDVDCANSVSDKMKDYVVTTIENIQSEKLQNYSGQTILLKVKFDIIS